MNSGALSGFGPVGTNSKIDDRPSMVEFVVTLRNGKKWTINAFETDSGHLGLTLDHDDHVVDVIEKSNGSGFVIG